MTQPTSTDAGGLSLDESSGRWVLVAMVLGSSLAFIDATVVSIALPAIGADLDAGLAGLAWTVNAYTLSLAALILLGGSLGDRLGRRRIFLVGVVWFACASLLCGIAPDLETLIAARALQGVGGALLTPGSLAILQSAYRPEDRARAIGAWSGLGGVAGAAGPFLGGWLVDAASWRWIFLINVPVAVAVVVIATRCVPESKDPTASRHTDVVGAVLVAIGLGGLTYGLLAWPDAGLRSVSVWLPLVGGVGALVAFFVWESRAHMPMLPLGIFSSALFNATNLVTFVVYAALGGVFFWLVLTLQVVTGFTPLAAGTALLPITVVMLALSARAGALGQRVGPRLPMTAGPLLAAVGVAGLVRIGEDSSYLVDVLPAVTVLGLGLALTVAPLTATALAAAPANHAGLASGVNNAVARVAGLLAVAILPVLVGLSGEAYSDPDVLGSAFHTAMWVCAALLALGGLLAAVLVRAPAEEPRPSTAGRIDTEAAPYHHCSVDAPPLAPTGPSSGPGA